LVEVYFIGGSMSEENKKEKLTIFGLRFWDLLIQKNLRNLSSMKYQTMLLLAYYIIGGMLDGKWVKDTWVSVIPVVHGLAFLGGGYITLVSSRIIANTKLVEKNGNSTMDTDN
jgi:hypothetical protein